MRGPGTNEDQIKSLTEKMEEDGINEAKAIVETYSQNTITLAYKLMRVKTATNKLPKSVSKLIEGLSEEDADIVRKKLTQVQVKVQ